LEDKQAQQKHAERLQVSTKDFSGGCVHIYQSYVLLLDSAVH
jgi:hypothetical protein